MYICDIMTEATEEGNSWNILLYVYIYAYVWLDVYMYVVFQRENWKIEFLDTLVYKDHNNRLQATFNKKQTDHQNYPHAKTAHALSLKKSIAYSQALRIKRVNTFKTCSTFDEYKNHSN